MGILIAERHHDDTPGVGPERSEDDQEKEVDRDAKAD